MNITVKAAHCFVSGHRYQHLVFNALIKHLDKLPLSPVVSFLQKPNCELPYCSKKHESIIEGCRYRGQRLRRNSPSVTLRVEPTLTVGALKSLLESEPWIPNENLVLVKHKKRPLDDDSSTLSDCGFKDRGGSLLACMGGSFTLSVEKVYGSSYFEVPVSSCFETLSDLKKKLFYVTGIKPEKQNIAFNSSWLPKKENTPLVSLGLVRPYSSDMVKHLNDIRLYRIAEG